MKVPLLIFSTCILGVCAFGNAQESLDNLVNCNEVLGDEYMVCIYKQLQSAHASLVQAQKDLQAQQETIATQGDLLTEQQSLIGSQQQRIENLQYDCKPLENSKGQDGWTLVYSNDFENPLHGMAHFNFTRRSYLQPMAGKKAADYDFILGLLHSDTLVFSLCSLPKHRQLKFSFDLYLLGSIDGALDEEGSAVSDSWYLQLDEKVLDSNLYLGHRTSIDDSHNYSLRPEDTNLQQYYSQSTIFADSASWGYAKPNIDFGDRHYDVTYERMHDDAQVILTMAFQFLEEHERYLNVFNESWAIDNLKVWVLEE